MTNVNEKRYPNISEAVAFRIAFAHMAYSYGDVGWDKIERYVCEHCGLTEQYADFLAPKSTFKKEFAILDTYHYGVSANIRKELIENFDVTEDDFRPCRNKTGDIVFYQITPVHTMLPLTSVNRTRPLKPCKKCGSIQYREKEYKNKNGYPYSFITQEVLNDLHDLNVTYEKYEMHLPYWVVSRRVYDFLIERYPRMNFQPIFLRTSFCEED